MSVWNWCVHLGAGRGYLQWGWGVGGKLMEQEEDRLKEGPLRLATASSGVVLG